ncbi:MAG TPA: DUF4229 domain-containing protein [Pedococcus sp.]|jgi:mannitol-specific phosphotransferase system IIBC component|nr:DUF4229 domain-containing protein [Pedococcus sp.]
MVRYSLLRALMFFGVLSALWLAGLRGATQVFPLVVLSALISMVLSFFVLKRFREESTQQIAAAVERRAAARRAKAPNSDEAAEDLEAEGGGPAEYR